VSEEDPYKNHPKVLSARKKVKVTLWLCLILLLITPLIPILAFNGVFMPQKELLPIWFQRSGSIVTILAVIIDAKLFTIASLILESGMQTSFDDAIRKGFRIPVFIVSSIALVTTVYGTLFGDMAICYCKHITSRLNGQKTVGFCSCLTNCSQLFFAA